MICKHCGRDFKEKTDKLKHFKPIMEFEDDRLCIRCPFVSCAKSNPVTLNPTGRLVPVSISEQ